MPSNYLSFGARADIGRKLRNSSADLFRKWGRPLKLTNFFHRNLSKSSLKFNLSVSTLLFTFNIFICFIHLLSILLKILFKYKIYKFNYFDQYNVIIS